MSNTGPGGEEQSVSGYGRCGPLAVNIYSSLLLVCIDWKAKNAFSRILWSTSSGCELVPSVRCTHARFGRWKVALLPCFWSFCWQVNRRSGFPEAPLDCGGFLVILASRVWLFVDSGGFLILADSTTGQFPTLAATSLTAVEAEIPLGGQSCPWLLRSFFEFYFPGLHCFWSHLIPYNKSSSA